MHQTPLLIVEDDLELLELFAGAFVRGGYAVTAVHHPRQALEAATCKCFRAAIIDFGLPEMNGGELIEKLNRRLAGLQAILLTGRSDDALYCEARQRGAFACLTKPCRLAVIQSVVAEALEAAAVEVG